MSKPSFLFTSSTFGPLKHVVQIKVALTAVRISFTPLHLLCTHFRQPVHWIEFLPTPFLHTAHGHLLGSSTTTLPSPAIITFVFLTFTFNPFPSMPSFHLSILSRNSPIFFAINTWSSAYKTPQGSPTLKPLVTTSITTTNSRGLKIDPDAVQPLLRSFHCLHSQTESMFLHLHTSSLLYVLAIHPPLPSSKPI